MAKMSFPKGELLDKIQERGKTQVTFAFVAGISPSTVYKACQGQDLSPSAFGKIIVALGALPRLNGSRRSKRAS